MPSSHQAPGGDSEPPGSSAADWLGRIPSNQRTATLLLEEVTRSEPGGAGGSDADAEKLLVLPRRWSFPEEMTIT